MMADLDVTALLRPHLRTTRPYSSARDEYSGEAMVFLDANENPYGSVVGGPWHRYPDPRATELRRALGGWLGVAADQVFVGNGSDEAIDLLVRAFCEPGEQRIVVTPPTYGMYRVAAESHGVGVVEVELTDAFQLDAGKVVAAIEPDCRLVFLCSPNNPTGNLLGRADVETVAAGAPGLVVLDEAYIDFAGDGASLVPDLAKLPNVVILRTFSKAWGMAAARVGAAVGHPEVIGVLDHIKLPYNLSGLAQQAALDALAHPERMLDMVGRIVAERGWLAERLAERPEVRAIHHSDANFLLVRFDDAPGTYAGLIERGVIVRDRSRVALCEGALRITVGTRDENVALLDALAEL